MTDRLEDLRSRRGFARQRHDGGGGQGMTHPSGLVILARPALLVIHDPGQAFGLGLRRLRKPSRISRAPIGRAKGTLVGVVEQGVRIHRRQREARGDFEALAVSGLGHDVVLDESEPGQTGLRADIDPELPLLQGRDERKVPRASQPADLAARLGRLGGLLVQGPTIALQPDGVAGHLVGGAQQIDVTGGISEVLALEAATEIALERPVARHAPAGRLQHIGDFTDFHHEDRTLGGRRDITQEISMQPQEPGLHLVVGAQRVMALTVRAHATGDKPRDVRNGGALEEPL